VVETAAPIFRRMSPAPAHRRFLAELKRRNVLRWRYTARCRLALKGADLIFPRISLRAGGDLLVWQP
jgi:hypothetical protein